MRVQIKYVLKSMQLSGLLIFYPVTGVFSLKYIYIIGHVCDTSIAFSLASHINIPHTSTQEVVEHNRH